MPSVLNIVEKLDNKYKNTGIYRFIFGNDIFITYSRIDGLDYALNLALKLGEKGYKCYVDQLSSNIPSGELPEEILCEVRRCTALVIIGSEGACNSENVKKEILAFKKGKGKRPIVVLDVDDNIKNEKAIWYEDVKGLAFVDINNEDLNKKEIGDDVINRIEATFNFRKRNKILSYIFNFGLLTLLLLILFAYLANQDRITAEKKTKIADSSRIVAEENQIEAETRTKLEEGKTIAAEKKTKIADSSRIVAEEEAKKADFLRVKAETDMRDAQEKQKIALEKLELAKKSLDSVEKVTSSNEISGDALGMLDSDPTIAFRLAEAANNITPTFYSTKALAMTFNDRSLFYNQIDKSIYKVKIIPNKDFFFTANLDETVSKWDYEGNNLKNFEKQSEIIQGLEYNDNLRLLAVILKNYVNIYNYDGQRESSIFVPNIGNGVAKFYNENKFICVYSNKIHLYNVKGKSLMETELSNRLASDYEVTYKYMNEKFFLEELKIRRDRSHPERDIYIKEIHIRDYENKFNNILKLSSGEKTVGVKISLDGNLIFTNNLDSIKIWDESGNLINKIPGIIDDEIFDFEISKKNIIYVLRNSRAGLLYDFSGRLIRKLNQQVYSGHAYLSDEGNLITIPISSTECDEKVDVCDTNENSLFSLKCFNIRNCRLCFSEEEYVISYTSMENNVTIPEGGNSLSIHKTGNFKIWKLNKWNYFIESETKNSKNYFANIYRKNTQLYEKKNLIPHNSSLYYMICENNVSKSLRFCYTFGHNLGSHRIDWGFANDKKFIIIKNDSQEINMYCIDPFYILNWVNNEKIFGNVMQLNETKIECDDNNISQYN